MKGENRQIFSSFFPQDSLNRCLIVKAQHVPYESVLFRLACSVKGRIRFLGSLCRSRRSPERKRRPRAGGSISCACCKGWFGRRTDATGQSLYDRTRRPAEHGTGTALASPSRRGWPYGGAGPTGGT